MQKNTFPCSFRIIRYFWEYTPCLGIISYCIFYLNFPPQPSIACRGHMNLYFTLNKNPINSVRRKGKDLWSNKPPVGSTGWVLRSKELSRFFLISCNKFIRLKLYFYVSYFPRLCIILQTKISKWFPSPCKTRSTRPIHSNRLYLHTKHKWVTCLRGGVSSSYLPSLSSFEM